jgi:hypothetical protein
LSICRVADRKSAKSESADFISRMVFCDTADKQSALL